MRIHTISALGLACLLTPGALAAQAGASGLGVSYQTYHFSDAAQTGADAMSLLTVPLVAQVPIAGGSYIDLRGNYASGSLRRADGTTAKLSGFTDTQVGVVLPVRPGMLTVTLVALLPTGKHSLTADEAQVAGIVAADLLPFPISNWGSGGGGGAAAALAHSFGRFGLGASASYLVSRRFDLTSQPVFGYQPGNQLRVRVVADAGVGPAGKASLQLTYLHSSDDKVDGSNLFRSGDRFQAMGSYAFPAGVTSSGIVYVGVLNRSKGSYLVSQPIDAASQRLYLAGGGLRVPVGRAVVLPSVDLRVLRRSDGLGQGYIGGVGSSVEFALGTHGLRLVPALRGRFGQVEAAQGSSTNFLGAELSLGVRFGGGRP